MNNKKFSSVFMALIMFLSCFTGFTTPVNAATPEVPLGDVVLSVTQKAQNIIKHNGVFSGQTMAMVTFKKDGKLYPAYCIQPWSNGVPEQGAYSVKANNVIDNAKVYTAISNGYPFVSNEDLGVKTDYEAYVITKLAVWSVIDKNYSDLSTNIYKAVAGKEYILEAFLKLAKQAQAATSMPSNEQNLTMTKLSEELSEDKNTLTQIFQVKSNGENFTGEYTATIAPNAPAGTIIKDKADGKFTVVIPLKDVPDNTSGSFNVVLSTNSGVGSAIIYQGNPSNSNYQSYAIPIEGTSGGGGVVNYRKDVDIPEKGSGALRILKREAGTLKPLSGATFRVIKLDGTDAGVIGDFVTDSKGEIVFTDLTVGAYKIQEINAPKGYILDVINVKNVTISAGNQTQQDITFDNFTTPKLKLKKISTNGEVVQGAMFKISLDGGNETYTGFTDVNGEIIFGETVDLKAGTYKVEEIAVPPPFLLDPTPQYVKLEPGKTGEAVFKNAKKAKWRIYKYIKGTETLLSGAEFSVTNLETNTIVWQGILEGGWHELDDLTPGWYRISEIATAHGYVMEWVDEYGTLHKDAPYKDIKLEADKELDIKFDNVQRPEIEIIKEDNFGNPVAGAIFEFKKADGSIQFVKQTDKDGKIIIEFNDKNLILTEGVYEVTETKAPEGYIMAKECSQTITLENGTRKVLTFVNTKKPTITILKIDAVTKKPLAGAKFKITQTENKTIKEAITDANGKITLTDLDDVIYTVEEITAPDGYILSSQHKDVKLKPGESMELVFENTKKPGLTILKIDEETKLPLVGATFRIQQTENKTIKEAITDKDGKIYLTDLDDVIYSISEIIPPKGYLLDPQHKDVKLKPGENMELVFTNKAKPRLRIIKVDANTGELLKNSEFKVTKLEDKTVSEYILENGEITLENLDEAIYRAEEFMAPEGYIILKDTKEIALEWGKTKTLKFDNIRKPVIIFTKTNALTGKGIAGAKFNVKFEMANGGVKDLGSFTTDSNGLIIIPKGEPGWYIFTETLPAPGYSKPSNPVTRKYFAPGENSYLPEFAKYYTVGTGKYASGYTPNDGTTTNPNTNPNTSTPVANEPTVPNNPIIGPTAPLATSVEVHSGSEYATSEGFNWPLNSIVLKKADANTGELLSGAVIELYRADEQVSGQPGTQIGRYVTDASGVVVIVGLEPGYYVAKEVQAPPFYILAETSLQNGFLKADGTTVLEMTFRNYPYGSLLVSKIDGVTGLPLANAKFKITDNTGAAVGNTTGEFITDAKGEALIEHVKPGSYIITEIKAPDNYAINTTPKTVQVGLDGKTYKVSFDNYPYASILVSKVDGITGEPLANTKFKITDNDGKAVGSTTGEFTTDAKGEILVSNVAPGSYIITEIKAPSNYAINTTPKTLQVGADDKIYKISFENYPYGSILISKIDGLTGKPLANATFKITDNDGKVVGNTTGEYISDSKGEILVPNVAPGSYVISEIKAPDNYAINTTPKTIEVGTDGKTIKASFENYPYGTLVLKKLDTDTKEPLANAEFKVITAKGDVVGNSNGVYKTDATGEIVIPNLPKGSYVIEELKAPTGYVLANQTQTIAIDYGKSYTLEFFNKKMSSLQIIKIDGNTKQPLKDAKFNVYKMNGELLGQYTTNGEGLIILDTLTPGWYKVSEFKAPDGYLIDESPKDVEITGNQFVKLVFENQPMASVIIKKFDKSSKAPLIGAKFKITKKSGDVVGEYTSDANGLIQLDNLAPGWYNAIEVTAPTGYKLIDQSQNFEVKHTKTVTLEFPNEKLTSLIIKKIDEKSTAPLAGAKFSVEKQNGEHIGDFTTDKDGTINIPTLAPDYYVIRETKAPEGYYLDESPKTVQVKTEVPTVSTFTNKKLTALEIIKVDELSNAPLNGAIFVVERQNGERIGEFTTSDKGIISIPTLQPDWYVVKEIKPPQGYFLDSTPQTVEVKTNTPTVVKFTNKKLTALEIIKTDEKSGEPLNGAVFVIERQNGERVGEFTTSEKGIISIPTLQPDWYVIKEIKAPDGYLIDTSPKVVEVKTDIPTVVKFTNKVKSGFQIIKIDAKTGTPLPGAKFTVYKKSGEVIGEFTTDNNGVIILDNLDNGWYKLAETKAPDGYMISETPKDIELTGNQFLKVVFENKKLTSLQIKKIDAITGAALPGAKFTIETQKGQKIFTNENGTEFVTDAQGFINVPTLNPDFYIIREVKAPENYIIDGTPQTVEVKTDTPTIVTFANQPLAGLKILKLNSVTKNPIEGAEFSINKMSGEKIENGARGFTFVTDKTGQIYIPNLANGFYVITEIKAPSGYVLDGQPKTVEVKSGSPTVVEVLNTPASGLLIVKTDALTGKPLYGVKFEIKKANGERVVSSLLDQNQPNTENNSPNKMTTPNGDISGVYTTDAQGRILINHLEVGEYNITEKEALKGYELDQTVHSVTVLPGKQAVLEVTNKAMSGLRLLKIDSVTKKGIYNVEFRIYDFETNKEVGGPYYTDNNGVIDFTGILNEGRYKIVETREAAGYMRDTLPRTIEFKAGKMTEIIWENTAQAGQIQITKKSSADNQMNGLPAGTVLAGAVFEVRQYKTGNVVDQFTTGSNGVGIGKALPLGRYTIHEIQAPMYYKISDKVIDVDIEFSTQILKFEFTNEPSNLSVDIKKVGPVEVTPGQQIKWDIKTVGNSSTVPLTDFYFRDVVPGDAVKLDKIITGNYNQAVRYKVMYKTNKNDYRVMYDGLSSTKNNVLDASSTAIGLYSDEYITEIMFVFGNVKAGFCLVEQPQVYGVVKAGLPNGYKFSNKVDVGGRYGTEWVISNSTWTTTVFNPNQPKLPRTGY